MLGGILILILSGIVAFAVIDQVKRKYPFLDTLLLKRLFFYHVLLSLAYYLYALFNPSDSAYYYDKVTWDYRGDTWGSFYGTSTIFIEFVGYPFIKYLMFSYEAVMALFSFFGFLGFIYFYIFFRENIRFRHTFMGFDLVTLIFFLPNLHFWSSSFGKGAVVFLGLGLYFFGISRVRKRWLAIFIGGLIIYHVRPHILLMALIASAIGFVFSTRGVSIAWRIVFIIGATVALFYIYQDVLSLVGISEDQFVSEGLDLTHRATELMNATSGVDITNYSLPMKIFTFLYRPLFVDAPGILGLIVSFENLFYLTITLLFLTKWGGFLYFVRADFLVKSAFICFLTVTIALAQISANLGLAMRQKSQVMILFMFVIVTFLDERKMIAWKSFRRKQKIRERLRRNAADPVGNL